jgi:predicted ATPase
MASFKEPPVNRPWTIFDRLKKFDDFSVEAGRMLLSPYVPGLKELSQEVIANEPVYQTFLRMAGLAPVYIALGGLFQVIFFTAKYFFVIGKDGALDFPFSVLPLLSYIGIGGGLLLLGLSVFGLRAVMQVRSRAASQADLERSKDPTFRDVERIRSERASLEERLFQRNLRDDFDLKAFEWRGVLLFEDGGYSFAPRVNVLLGKNGYGKTLLFRSLTAMLQRDGDYSGLLFPGADKSARSEASESHSRLRVQVTRNGETEEIMRDDTYFFEKNDAGPVGKIPMLAIPDSRFLNRTRRTVAGSASTGNESLASSGARNYLTQEPYESVVQDLLTQLCLDFLEPGGMKGSKKFDRQIFRLVEEVVGELTEDNEFHFVDIQRVGTSGFEILVRSGGTQNAAIPIQSASQGTLSIVAIFGLIYSFLHSLRPELSEDKICTGSAIVLIDEIDAHLHPSWQQKILGMLTRRFPNVQFIVSAHSPVIVAGCDKGEVSVLRRRSKKGKFYVDTLPRDFLGATAQELYEDVFEIEDVDRLYLEFTAKGSKGQEERGRDIERLQAKPRLSAEEQERLTELLRETRLVGRAEEARTQRLKSARDETQFAMLDDEVERLKHNLREKDNELREKVNEIARLKEESREKEGVLVEPIENADQPAGRTGDVVP